MKSLFLTLSSLAALSLAASAQQVTFQAEVENVQGGGFVVDCSDTSLTSSAFNLNAFVSENVLITGIWNGSAANPSVEVTAIQIVPEVFEIGGGAKIGDDSHLGITGPPGAFAFGAITLQPTFVPLADGVLFIDLGTLVLMLSETIGGDGDAEIEFFIPNDPSLIGLDIYGQGAYVESDGTLVIGAPDCKEIDD